MHNNTAVLSMWQTHLFQFGTWRSGKDKIYDRIQPSLTYKSMMQKDEVDVFGDERVRVTTILVSFWISDMMIGQLSKEDPT